MLRCCGPELDAGVAHGFHGDTDTETKTDVSMHAHTLCVCILTSMSMHISPPHPQICPQRGREEAAPISNGHTQCPARYLQSDFPVKETEKAGHATSSQGQSDRAQNP